MKTKALFSLALLLALVLPSYAQLTNTQINDSINRRFPADGRSAVTTAQMNRALKWLLTGSYIPLSGTALNKPVTGNLQVYDDFEIYNAYDNGPTEQLRKSLKFGYRSVTLEGRNTANGEVGYFYASSNGLVMGVEGSPDPGEAAIAMDFSTSDQSILITGAAESFKGIQYLDDVSPNFQDYSLVHKKWVLDQIAAGGGGPGGSYIPLSGSSAITGKLSYNTDIYTTTPTDRNILDYGTMKELFAPFGSGGTTLPAQAGNAGKMLRTNGSALSWSNTLTGLGNTSATYSLIAQSLNAVNRFQVRDDGVVMLNSLSAISGGVINLTGAALNLNGNNLNGAVLNNSTVAGALNVNNLNLNNIGNALFRGATAMTSDAGTMSGVVVMPQATNPGGTRTLTAGNIALWNNGGVPTFKDGTGQEIPIVPARTGALYAQGLPKTVNTSTKTSVITSGKGAATIPANTLTVGSTIRIKGKGRYSTPSVASTLVVTLGLSGTEVASGAVNLPINLTNYYMEWEIEVAIYTIGPTGSFMPRGRVTCGNPNGDWMNVAIVPNGSGFPINTTVNQPVQVYYTTTALDATAQTLTIEVL